MGAFLLLRAFAASCTALTGTEAIADGVQAFKPPEARNAARTLLLMVGLLLAMFMGLSYLAMHEGIVPMASGSEGFKTVVAQIAIAHWGDGTMFGILQVTTAAILFLAANTELHRSRWLLATPAEQPR
jgi:amino acid transporter